MAIACASRRVSQEDFYLSGRPSTRFAVKQVIGAHWCWIATVNVFLGEICNFGSSVSLETSRPLPALVASFTFFSARLRCWETLDSTLEFRPGSRANLSVLVGYGVLLSQCYLFIYLCLARISSVTSAVSCPLSVLVVSRNAVSLVCCFVVFPFCSRALCWMDSWLNQEFVSEHSAEAIVERNQR